ncbi:MAG: hypothetical protein ACM3U2_01000 [Deltaproteobacteria bacterium]
MHDDDFSSNWTQTIGEFGAPAHLDEFITMGVDPTQSTAARPGTEEKVLMLSARYAAGVALWNTRDRRDHGLKECELMGAILGIDQQP